MDASTATLIAAAIGAAGLVLVAFLNIHQSRQLATIHVLVNSNLTTVKDQLTQALERIEQLEAVLTRERAQP